MFFHARDGDAPLPEVVRGVAVIVAVGAALGIGFNVLQRASGPRKGLSWIKREVRLASLEELSAQAAPGDTAATAAGGEGPGGHAPPATTVAPHRGGVPAATAAPRGDGAGGAGAEDDPGARPPASASAPARPGASARDGAATAPPPATGAAPAAHSGAPATARGDSTAAAAAAPGRRIDLPFIPDTREPLEVQYATIRKFYDADAALFVDARSAEEYAEGHIPGAVNLPFDDVFRDQSLASSFDGRGKPLVVYCGGGDCELSRNLAFSLIEGGHRKVLVFMGGTAGWTEAGNALLPGAAPGARPR
jgi:rhodanese-related sulfurtransferase